MPDQLSVAKLVEQTTAKLHGEEISAFLAWLAAAGAPISVEQLVVLDARLVSRLLREYGLAASRKGFAPAPRPKLGLLDL